MRASEALMLGSTLLTPLRRVFDNGYGAGCALGMINRALGGDAHNSRLNHAFPWMLEARETLRINGANIFNAQQAVMYLFDNEVMTIPQIAEWLESIDPTPREVPVPAEAKELACPLA